MLERVQIRASGQTAHDVEAELRWIAQRITADLGLEAELADQVIEGTPGQKFAGRLTLTVTNGPTNAGSGSSGGLSWQNVTAGWPGHGGPV